MYQIIGEDGVPGSTIGAEELQAMVSDGRLDPEAKVLDSSDNETVSAGEILARAELNSHLGIVPEEPTPEPVVATEPAPGFSPMAVPELIAPIPAPAPVVDAGIATSTSTVPVAPMPPPVTATPISPVASPAADYPTLASGIEADLGARFIGILIDGLIAIPLNIAAAIPFVGIIGAPLALAYWLSRDMFFKGQSVGKRVAKTRVVKLDGSPFTWMDSALRNIVYLPLLGCMIPIIGLIFLQLMGPIMLAETICVIVTKRRIGDYLAKTQVVMAE